MWIWSNNANTLLMRDDFSELHELCLALKDYSPAIGIIALQEINLDTLQPDIRTNIESVFKQHFGAVRLITSTSPIRAPHAWKPGGTLLAVVGHWSHSVIDTGADELGRWSRATLGGRDGSLLTVYSLYNVVDTKIGQVGPSTVFAQQWHLLRTAGNTNPNPRQQCVDDLHQDLAECKKRGSDICIVGDFNEVLGTNPSLMASVCTKFDLYDVLASHHPDADSQPTYIRGQKRLDYLLLSRTLRPSVQAVGMNRYHMLYHSDHRAPFLGLDKQSTFGLPSPIARTSLRHIESNSQSVAKFIQLVYAHLTENKVFHSFAEFLQDVDTADRPYIAADSIDRSIGHALSAAERKCAIPPRPPWSEKLHLASLQVRYWKTALSACTTRADVNDELIAIQAQIASQPPVPSSPVAIQRQLSQATKLLRTVRKHAVLARRDFLLELKERIASRKTSCDLPIADALKIIDRQLRSKKVYSRIARAVKEFSSQSLTKVEIVRESTHLDPTTGALVTLQAGRTVVDTRKELETAILARNQAHFAQAKTDRTPWTERPLSLIGTSNNFSLYQDPTGHNIELPADTFPETSLVLQILKDEAAANHPGWSSQVSFQDFISGILHWKESTSTSPSGRHLGIYRSLVTAYCDSGGEFRQERNDDGVSVQEQAEAILQLIHGLASSAATYGFFLDRWRTVVNVMIYKKPGCLELDKLRVIHLFEADFNLIVGLLFGRRAMHHAADHRLIHKGQYGQPGGECLDVAFSKILHNIMATLTKTAMGQFESDAASCFDRIVMLFAICGFITLGAPLAAATMWLKTLYRIVHSVKTGFGLSQDCYHYSPATPIIGPGQGSKGGPAACSMITSPLLKAMDQLATGISFCDPRQLLQYTVKALMFIDDNTNYSNRFLPWLQQPPTATILRDTLERDAQIWERLLWTSGGLLKLPKCLYYLMKWEFDDEGKATLAHKQDLPDMHLTSGASPRKEKINQHNSDEAHRTLGCWLSTNFQMHTALSILKQKAHHFGRKLLCSSLDKYEAWIAYFVVFIPMMTYTFGISHHSSKHLAHMQSQPTRATLMKIGFNRNTALAVVFGAVIFGGLGMRHLYIEQGIAQLQLFIRHLRAGTDQGTLLRITIAWWQLVAGVSFPLLLHPDVPVPYLPNDWLSSLRGFLSFINGYLHMDGIAEDMPQRCRLDDCNIMDAILRCHPTPAEQASVNRCRLWMGVAYLSEITTANGRELSRDAWEGTRSRHSPILWPFQPKPGPESLKTWRRFLATAFLEGERKRVELRTRDLVLQHPVGNWTHSSGWLQSKWKSFYSSESQTVYILDPVLHRYNAHSQKRRSRWTRTGRNSLHHSAPSRSTKSLPSDAIPIDAVTNGSVIHFPSVAHIRHCPPPHTAPNASTWQEYIRHLPRWDRLLVEDNSIPDINSLLAVIQTEPTLFLCSDGGAKDFKGSFGAVLATGKTILANVGGQAYGANPRSFRAEGYGMLAILRLLYHLTTFWDLHRVGKLLLLCDNAGLLQRVHTAHQAKYVKPRRYLYSEADLEMQIMDSLRLLKSTFALEHVLGHQDDGTDEPLPWKASLNVRCDAIATATLDNIQTVEPDVPFLPACKVALTIAGTTITHHLPTQIRQHYGKRLQTAYLCARHHWEIDQFDTVDWELFRSSILDFSLPKRFFLVKWVNHLLPFQSQQFRYLQSTSPACPSSCGDGHEDEDHFLRCTHSARLQSLLALHESLVNTFDRHHVDPYLRRALTSLLAPYTNIPTDTSRLPAEYQALLESQRSLGDDSHMYGFFHVSWIQLQNRYLGHMHLPRNKNQATTAIKAWILLIFDGLHDLWLLRNDHLHGNSPASLHSYKRLQLLTEINQLYAQKDLLLASDRDILSQPVEHWESQSTTSLRSFLAFAKPVATISIRQAADMGSNFRPIDDYFRRPIPQHVIDAICIRRTPSASLYSQPEPD
jgi:hypothetical protein